MEPNWLTCARELQGIAQNGLTYATDRFDRERYEAVRAVAARMLAEGAGVAAEPVAALLAAERGYATPKVGVRAAVFRGDGALLMVRETADGRWALPGGWADINQSPAESVAREVLEESGFAVVPRKLAAVFDRIGSTAGRWPFHIYRLFFVCGIAGGAARPGHDTSEIGFFAEPDIPPDLSAARSSRHHIARMFAHHRAPDLPTEFD